MNPKTIDLAKEVDRLTEEMQEWTEKQADTEFGSDAYRRMEYEGSTQQRYRSGVKWAETEFGSVDLRPITDGLRRAIRDVTESTGYDRDQVLVALGTQDAPYIEHEPNEISPDNPEIKDTLANIAELHPGYVDWANERIQDLWGMSDDLGNSYLGMLLETQRKKTHQETTGSDTAE